MKKLIIVIIAILNIQISVSQSLSKEIEKEGYNILLEKFSVVDKDMDCLKRDMRKMSFQLYSLSTENEELHFLFDSLCSDYLKKNEKQEMDKAVMKQKVDETNKSVIGNQVLLKNHAVYGILIVSLLIAILIIVVHWLFKRIRDGNLSIDELRKMQETLRITQIKMQEESIKLDNKFVEISVQQMKTAPVTTNDAMAIDHSLVLKVADEIVRIELNLFRMDSSIKGYKQLAKAVQRIKDNFQANGYEIIDMLGKPYNEGMKVTANFVSDENIEQGKQIITGIIKPQINYNGKMIQSAQITVSQNI